MLIVRTYVASPRVLWFPNIFNATLALSLDETRKLSNHNGGLHCFSEQCTFLIGTV